MQTQDLYPIGQQSFESLRKGGAFYVDKTRFIEKIICSKSQYYFLGRPRRFGKSLFLSTMKCFFEGKRNLFKGLYIDAVDWKWEPWPVIYLDLNTRRFEKSGQLDAMLDNIFIPLEAKYGVNRITENLSDRFKNIIDAAYEKTKKQVIILVDEYDKPLVNNINHHENFEHYRNSLASVYSNFKSSSDHIRLVFLTGVSRFSRLNIFSDLNNINEITFDDDYAEICGISEKELHEYFKEGIQRLAEDNDVSYEEASRALKQSYDGYQFSKRKSDMYNPWSLLNALSKRVIDDYWNETGMPTLVAESLRRLNVDLKEVFNTICPKSYLVGLDLLNPMPAALLYQTGYLTIKECEGSLGQEIYTLGIPNREVKKGLFNTLLPYYVQSKSQNAPFEIYEFVKDVKAGRPKEFMTRMESFFASMPFKLRVSNECDLQNAIYIFISLVGLQVNAEEMTSDGAIDIKIQTSDYIYLIELKYNKSAQSALDQINEKQYALPFAYDGRRIIKIGANFSSRKRRINDILIE